MNQQNFNPARALPDSLFGFADMDIQQFFLDRKSFLANFVTYAGNRANQIIKDTTRAFNVNPKLILVSLQREQGLIETKNAGDIKSYTKENGVKIDPLDWCLGVGLLDKGQVLSPYKGFAVQIKEACHIYRKYYNAPLEINGGIMPENHFTSTLLMYTPHVEALKLTHDLWLKYFPKDLQTGSAT